MPSAKEARTVVREEPVMGFDVSARRLAFFLAITGAVTLLAAPINWRRRRNTDPGRGIGRAPPRVDRHPRAIGAHARGRRSTPAELPDADKPKDDGSDEKPEGEKSADDPQAMPRTKGAEGRRSGRVARWPRTQSSHAAEVRRTTASRTTGNHATTGRLQRGLRGPNDARSAALSVGNAETNRKDRRRRASCS